jgi:Flp pilus assembly protein TadB
MKFLEEVGKAFVPKKVRPNLRFYLSRAGIQEVPYKSFGVLFFVVVAMVAIIYISTDIFSQAGNIAKGSIVFTGLLVFSFWIICLALLSAAIIGGIAFYLNMKIFARVKEIDSALPDYLILVSTNLKGGLSFEKSLWSAMKPEFGVLSDEMGMVSKKVMTGSDLAEALKEFAEKYDSPSVKRTIDLILGEIQSGGQVAKVLDQTIDSLRKTRLIKEEMSANTLMFTIFIAVIVIFISPLLFALAYNLLSILISVSAQIAPALEDAKGLPFKMKEVPLNKEDFKIFSMLALTIISVSSAMILSIIQKGDIKSGLKYILLFVIVSVVFYLIFVNALSGVFGSMF